MQSPFDLASSLERTRLRMGKGTGPSPRAPRSDRGLSRLPPEVTAAVAEALSDQERPRASEILARVAETCAARGLPPPSRATVYRLMDLLPCPRVRAGDLPPAVREALYNLEADSEVPLHQVAFLCFNHGDLRAISFAAGLPWLALHQALRLRGWRGRSRGLAEAVAAARGA